MVIGVVSDTHNNVERAITAGQQLQSLGVEVVIHCGDVGGPGVIDALADFELHIVFGNVDHDPAALRRAIEGLPRPATYGETYTDTIDGVRVAACHGHSRELERLVTSGSHQYVFHGHTHQRKNELREGGQRIVNPGALGGIPKQSRSFCTVDLASGTVEFYEL